MTANTIRLKEATQLSTGYRGRGRPSKWISVPAGTVVGYSRYVANPSLDYLPYVETWHKVFILRDGVEYSASRLTIALRQPFAPATYYGWAIRRLSTGVWSCAGTGRYYADDGFGNLVATPNEFDSFHLYNEFSTSKMVVDCIEGPVYFF